LSAYVTEDLRHTCGHEFIGEIVDLGDNFGKSNPGRPALYSSLKVGDRVVSPFTVNCGECQYVVYTFSLGFSALSSVCRLGYTARCPQGALFGSPILEGGQAQYVRVPKAGGTLFNLSDPSTWSTSLPIEVRQTALSKIADSSLLVLADILPTGVFAATQLMNHPKLAPILSGKPWPLCFTPDADAGNEVGLLAEDRVLNLAIIGLGPVGICTLVSILDILATRTIAYRIVAIDPLESRRQKALDVYAAIDESGKGAGELVALGIDEAKIKMKEWTDGAGATAVFEVSTLILLSTLLNPFRLLETQVRFPSHMSLFSHSV